MVKILLVDDRAEDMMYSKRCLKCLGYSDILEATDGKYVLDLMNSDRPDLILMDTFMKEMDGPLTCEEVRKTNYGKQIGIIGMSGYGCKKDWEDAGADAFVLKNSDNAWNPEIMGPVVKSVLGKYGGL